MTYSLRPLSERLANGVADTKGHSGAGVAPYRTQGKRTKNLYKKDGKLTWTDESQCSATAKGYPAEEKIVDNNGDLNWDTVPKAKGLGEMEAKCPGADYWPRLVQQGEELTEMSDGSLKMIAKWVELKPAKVEWAECDGQIVARPVCPKPHAEREELTSLSQGCFEYEATELNYEKDLNYPHPTREQREEAAMTQVRCFASRPQRVVYDVKTCLAKGKYEAKTKALDGALSAAFRPRHKTASDAHLYLDTVDADAEVGNAWTPTTEDPLEQLMRRELWAKVVAGLTAKQMEAVELTAIGESLTTTQRRHLQMARQKVARKG